MTKMQGTSKANLPINTKDLSTKTLLYFITFEIVFVLLDLIVNFHHLIDYSPVRRLFNITREDGLASWFMSSQTLLVALTLWFIFYLHHKLDIGRNSTKLAWAILASFFTYMSADDGAAIHERLGSTFKLMAKSANTETSNAILAYFPSYAWQIVVLPLFLGMGIFMLLFLWKTFKNDMLMYTVLLGFSMLGTAVVLDFFEGLEPESPLYIYQYIINFTGVELHTVEHFSKSIEEFLEMVGITLFLSVFVEYIGRVSQKDIHITFTAIL
ncbi:MAG: hypothetical protein COA39_004425 [Sulfurimonas sp.]|nr:hypothetical protein [Sulfurimonas sp.]